MANANRGNDIAQEKSQVREFIGKKICVTGWVTGFVPLIFLPFRSSPEDCGTNGKINATAIAIAMIERVYRRR